MDNDAIGHQMLRANACQTEGLCAREATCLADYVNPKHDQHGLSWAQLKEMAIFLGLPNLSRFSIFESTLFQLLSLEV